MSVVYASQTLWYCTPKMVKLLLRSCLQTFLTFLGSLSVYFRLQLSFMLVHVWGSFVCYTQEPQAETALELLLGMSVLLDDSIKELSLEQAGTL